MPYEASLQETQPFRQKENREGSDTPWELNISSSINNDCDQLEVPTEISLEYVFSQIINLRTYEVWARIPVS